MDLMYCIQICVNIIFNFIKWLQIMNNLYTTNFIGTIQQNHYKYDLLTIYLITIV
jgi:hypothetical protein